MSENFFIGRIKKCPKSFIGRIKKMSENFFLAEIEFCRIDPCATFWTTRLKQKIFIIVIFIKICLIIKNILM
jgi:hypothetical protein